jgi:hypothetical protein
MLDAVLIRQMAKCRLHSRVGNAHAVADLLPGEFGFDVEHRDPDG